MSIFVLRVLRAHPCSGWFVFIVCSISFVVGWAFLAEAVRGKNCKTPDPNEYEICLRIMWMCSIFGFMITFMGVLFCVHKSDFGVSRNQVVNV